jgi:uncharacterized Zn-finger protein
MAGTLSHILDGPGSDPRPLSAPEPLPLSMSGSGSGTGSIPAPASAPVPEPVSETLLAAKQQAVGSDAIATSIAGPVPSNPPTQSHITMQAVPSSTTPGPPSASPGANTTAGTTTSASDTTIDTFAGSVTGEAPAPAPHQSHQNSNPYACRDCGRSYSRPEHLVRHVQTHTLGRRFACEICNKSFARKDLLRRHVTNHENDSPRKRQRLVSTPNSSRVTQACRPCAAARVKCDETKPCRRCVSRNLACSAIETSPGSSTHLVHLPGSGQDAPAQSQPNNGSYIASTDSNSTLQNTPMSFIRDNTASKSSPLSQTTSSRQDESQLTTPDTGVDSGKSCS